MYICCDSHHNFDTNNNKQEKKMENKSNHIAHWELNATQGIGK